MAKLVTKKIGRQQQRYAFFKGDKSFSLVGPDFPRVTSLRIPETFQKCIAMISQVLIEVGPSHWYGVHVVHRCSYEITVYDNNEVISSQKHIHTKKTLAIYRIADNRSSLYLSNNKISISPSSFYLQVTIETTVAMAKDDVDGDLPDQDQAKEFYAKYEPKEARGRPTLYKDQGAFNKP
ncbi:hypothetical protein KUTeg_009652 [Tegillarca granosa]|uniref:Uncharacterized protein n=1 Tax=Tegillarca granosa TaxID=220873 RepID=A0ABQ9F4H4_TEGGR|nr:hypothetical protein KUTeg_009652 [Tegillarca granosa]